MWLINPQNSVLTTVLNISFKLQDELDRLQELKLQNIKNVIDVIRTEIKSYWDKCFYGDEQRRAFTPYYDGK